MDSAQAERSLNTFKNSLTSLGAATTKTQSTIQTFNATLSKQAQAFNATLTPIKQQGAALNTLTTNLKSHATQLSTVGSKIKDTASKFAGFATGLSATASGVLQLTAGFRDYNDATIAVERVQRKLSLATEAQNKAQDKLKGLTDKGIKSGKEYAAAQLDVEQAQAAVSIQTQLLGESQERLFDAQTQFVASVIPTTLGAIGTLGSAFKDLGGEKGLGGLVTKFKGLGTTFTNFGTSLTGASGGVKGLIGNLGALGFAVVGAAGLFEEFNKQLKINQDVAAGAIRPIDGVTQTLDRMSKLDFSNVEQIIISIAKLTGGSAAYADLVKKIAAGDIEKLSKQTTELSIAQEKLAADQQKLIDLAKERQTTGVKQQQAELKATIELDKAEVARLSTIDKTTAAITKQGTATKNIIGDVNNFTKAWDQSAISVSKNEAILTGFGTNIDDLAKKFGALSAAQKDLFGTKFTQNVMQYNKLISQGNLTATTRLPDLPGLVEQTNKAAKDLNKTWEVDAGKIAAQNTAKALEEAKKKAEEFKKSLAAAQTDIKGVFKIDSNANKILKDLIDKLPNEAEKEIKLQLKFGQSVEDNKKAFNDLLFEATQVDDKTADAAANQIIKIIDDKFKGNKGAFAGLRAILQAAIADPNTPEALKTILINFNWDTVGQSIGKELGIGTFAGFKAEIGEGKISALGLSQLKQSINTEASKIFGGGGGEGIVIPVATPVIPPPDTKQFDAGVATIKTSLANISKTVPKATINIDDGLGMMGELKRAWDKTAGQLSKQIPKLSVNADKAFDIIGELKRGWDKVASQIQKKVPKITVNADQALDMIGEVKRGMDKIKDKTVTIRVNQTGSGLRQAQHGMHEVLAQDTLIQAHGGERVDIGHGGGSTSISRGGGGGGTGSGDIIVNLTNVNNDKETTRSFKRSLGQGVYLFGA